MRLPGETSPRVRAMLLGRLFVLILLAQAVLVCLLGNWSSLQGPVRTTTWTPRLVWLGGSGEGAAALPGGAVFAEVSSAGFSGALWRGGDAARLSAPLARGFDEGIGAVAVPGPWFDDSPPPELARRPVPSPPGIHPGARLATGPAPGARPGVSRLRLRGPLASLPVRSPGVLPIWTNTDVLVPTTVQLLVESGGGVLSAALLPAGSGLAAADQEGLRLARELQFPSGAPDGVEDQDRKLVWGTVEFIWHTVEPPARP